MINSVRATVVLLIFFSVNLFAAGGGGGGGSSTASYAVSLPESIPKLVDDARYDEAIDALNTYISEESRNADAWNLLGYSLRKVELYDESLRAYKKALKLDRKHLGAREYLGELYLVMGEPGKAAKQLKKLKRYCGECEQYSKLEQAINNYQENS